MCRLWTYKTPTLPGVYRTELVIELSKWGFFTTQPAAHGMVLLLPPSVPKYEHFSFHPKSN
jgi:hypothetical protein